jgi:hypothetical protein
MATGKTILSGFSSEVAGYADWGTMEQMHTEITNKRIEAIFNKNFPRRFMLQGYSDYSRYQDYNRCSIPPAKVVGRCLKVG